MRLFRTRGGSPPRTRGGRGLGRAGDAASGPRTRGDRGVPRNRACRGQFFERTFIFYGGLLLFPTSLWTLILYYEATCTVFLSDCGLTEGVHVPPVRCPLLGTPLAGDTTSVAWRIAPSDARGCGLAPKLEPDHIVLSFTVNWRLKSLAFFQRSTEFIGQHRRNSDHKFEIITLPC